MKHREGPHVSIALRKIETETLELARTFGFSKLTQVERERNRLRDISHQNFKKLKTGEFARVIALDSIARALDVAQHFDTQIELLIAEARDANSNARRWIEEEVREIEEEQSHSRRAKAA
jgi:hypothetical protein